MLYTFKKKNAHFTELSFVATAVSKDESRPNLQQIYVGGGDIVGIDGRRAHIYKPETEVLEPGLYKVVKHTKTILELYKLEDGPEFPDYKRVVPKNVQTAEFTNKGLDGLYCEVIRSMDPLYGLNHKYFSDLHHIVTEFGQNDANGPVYFTGHNIEAVIMPVRLNK